MILLTKLSSERCVGACFADAHASSSKSWSQLTGEGDTSSAVWVEEDQVATRTDTLIRSLYINFLLVLIDILVSNVHGVRASRARSSRRSDRCCSESYQVIPDWGSL